MKILLFINWKIKYLEEIPTDIQPSDYCCTKERFWFFKYFNTDTQVDVIDISANRFIEKIEKKLHFHFWQTLRNLKKLKKYDLIMYHGSDSAVFLGVLKRFFHFKTPPVVVVDISSFHQADEKGLINGLCRYASKAFDWLVYHTSSQKEYFEKYYPWLVSKSTFIPVGVDFKYWADKKYNVSENKGKYIICVGYRKRDWNTLIKAFEKISSEIELFMIGNPDLVVDNPKIKVLPFIPINELMDYIYNAKCSIVPLDSFNYSFGQLTILQQMALGIPVVAADVPSLKDYIHNGDGTIPYIPYDCDDLAEKINLVLKMSDSKLKEIGESNQTVIRDILSEENMAHEFEKVCFNLISK